MMRRLLGDHRGEKKEIVVRLSTLILDQDILEISVSDADERLRRETRW
jgi:hypothetical protein